MKNKIELKKALVCSIVVILLFNIVFGIIQFYQYKTYTENFNAKISAVITKVKQEYPDIDNNELIEILNNTKSNTEIFKDYGIDLNNDALVLENDQYFEKFLCINIVLITIATILILAIFLMYNKSKDKTLKEITKYIEEINNKNYKLDIDGNTEDELSILKNEVYKTTVMLKEVAENSVNDKLNLKNSLSDISHQLKTPLTSITIMLDNILENPNMDEDTRMDFMKDIKREIVNINFLVQALLKLSRLDANSVNFVKQEIFINDIIGESMKNLAVLCDLKSVQINVIGDKESKVFADLKWQVEAVTNILKNAIEHSAEGSKIDVFYEQNKMYSKIEIKDYGVGISDKDLSHIFDRFYKGEHSASDSIGIGLALSKAIIERNNGYVSVESKAGKGTKFVIKYFE